MVIAVVYKKGVLIISILLLLLPAVYGQGYFTVSSGIIQDRIMINEIARFKLTIENNQDFDDDFRIYYSDVEWDFSTDPRTDSTVHIAKGERRDVVVILKPLRVGYGSHGVTINIRAVKGDRLARHSVLVDIISLGLWERGYPIAIRTEVDMPLRIDPRIEQKIVIDIGNQYAVNVTNMVVKATSSLFNKERVINLKPLGEERVVFKLDFDRAQPPTKDTVKITFNADNLTFKEVEKEFEVIAYVELQKDVKPPKMEFLKKYKEVIVTNNGNSKLAEKVREAAPKFTFLYAFTRPRADIVYEGGKKYYSWDVALEPGASIIIRINESYRPLFTIILLVGIVLLCYYTLRSPVVVRKDAKGTLSEDGGISQVKIVLHIKNRTSKRIKELVISDRVPKITDVIKKFKIGSLQPTKILHHEKKGSIVKWEIEELEPFEERLITYNIRTKLTVLGAMKLPSAIAKFKDARGREGVTSSNVCLIRS